MITSSNNVLKDFQSDMAVEIRMLVNPTCETAKSNVIANQNVGF